MIEAIYEASRRSFKGDSTRRSAPRMNENVRSNGFSRLTTEVVTTNFIYKGEYYDKCNYWTWVGISTPR